MSLTSGKTKATTLGQDKRMRKYIGLLAWNWGSRRGAGSQVGMRLEQSGCSMSLPELGTGSEWGICAKEVMPTKPTQTVM